MTQREGFAVVNYQDELIGIDGFGPFVPDHIGNIAYFRSADDAQRFAEFVNQGEPERKARAVRCRLELTEL